MNFGRSPILLIVALFFLLFIVLSIINRKSSTSVNDNDRALRTSQALNRVMDAEATFLKQHGSYTGHVADLIPLQPKIATDLTDSIVNIQVDSSGDKTYFVQVGSTVLLLNRTVTNGKVVQQLPADQERGQAVLHADDLRHQEDAPERPDRPTGPTGPTAP